MNNNEMIMVTIGNRIREFRIAKQMTIRELARDSAMNESQLGKIERGERNVTIGTLDRILEALQIPYNLFFSFGEEIRSEPEALQEKTKRCFQRLDEKEKREMCSLADMLVAKVETT